MLIDYQINSMASNDRTLLKSFCSVENFRLEAIRWFTMVDLIR